MWERLETKSIFRGKEVSVRRDMVRGPSGNPSEYVILDGPAIALTVPLLDDGRVVLVRQFRYAWGQDSWECPAGHSEPGETGEQAAQRELEEETGYRAAKLEPLLQLYGSSRLGYRFLTFLGTGLTKGPPRPDPDEDLVVRAFSREELHDLIRRGEIVHGPSLAALLRVVPMA